MYADVIAVTVTDYNIVKVFEAVDIKGLFAVYTWIEQGRPIDGLWHFYEQAGMIVFCDFHCVAPRACYRIITGAITSDCNKCN